jgi:hypothetical protein
LQGEGALIATFWQRRIETPERPIAKTLQFQYQASTHPNFQFNNNNNNNNVFSKCLYINTEYGNRNRCRKCMQKDENAVSKTPTQTSEDYICNHPT